ncbi:carboxypeptidase-like regulatory domain-containing protein [Prolixibacteraceae bacterium Z1-6]|uniref:Carboxypeptidase-like regulatory domain-containing protein n=1 Tax=Draconibacterium aestuarii TaxID=2998507 RepID=A0A9X3FAG0_9BACT|nr:carboxypeptidase-like regulatory domain-containing protein [Prolixibacteraceae bacterium Z1-6]
MKNSLLLSALLLIFCAGFAQDDDFEVDPMLIELKAQILSAGDSTGVPYANIILHRTHAGTITNGEGYFSLEMLNIDSLEVTSVGYEKTILKIPAYYTGFEVLTFYMKPILYNVGEVRVEGAAQKLEYFDHGNPTNIDPTLRGDAFNEKPSVIAALLSPLSFAQYHGKREKRKREVREDMAIMRNWEMHSENYNKEMVMKLTGTTEAYADTFMVWFNGQNVLPYTANEYQVREAIIQYYELFKMDYDLE